MESTTQPNLESVDVLRDYALAVLSREMSLVGRREVMGGKAKFGIFGDGKELPQLALAKVFQLGDWRAGYYRDQTLMLALGLVTVEQFFAQLYAHASLEADPHSGGRQMNAHFATRFLNDDGSWRSQTNTYNSSADLSPTGSQMPRLVGLGYASRLYREIKELHTFTQFSRQGSEIAFGTIGNASCAEGMFWEAVNAIGVLHAPVVLSIWDDGYGISVPNEFQVTKGDLSALLSGFQRDEHTRGGYDVYTVRAWDYPALLATYQQAADTARAEHVPALIHVIDVTQPQGHSTSGSHERYKSPERLAWEEEFDGIRRMREWIIRMEFTGPDELDEIEASARSEVQEHRAAAWDACTGEIAFEREELLHVLTSVEGESRNAASVTAIRQNLGMVRQPLRKDVALAARQAVFATRGENGPAHQALASWKAQYESASRQLYDSHITAEEERSAFNVPEVPATYGPEPDTVTGFNLMNANFDAILSRYPQVIAFGEDVGKLGDVNQGFAGLQDKYGALRVADTGIRETTIMGQAIGMALRGLRPIAEIQYLDYLLYAIQILSDDLATLQWRTVGGQKAPVIIRTRGHRLEGVWHSGSLLGGIIHLLRGVNVLVPRNMTQAAGFYNTMLRSDDSALIIEVLNGYRLKETLPQNLGEYTIPLGVPEVLRPGQDVTLVTYGAAVPIALEGATLLANAGIEVEVIDVRTLLPFDLRAIILDSLKKTNRMVFMDEDVPGGASAYMMQQVIEKQGGYHWLDSQPRTLTGTQHRPAYGSDGNYFSKPNAEDVFELIYMIMRDADPGQFPAL